MCEMNTIVSNLSTVNWFFFHLRKDIQYKKEFCHTCCVSEHNKLNLQSASPHFGLPKGNGLHVSFIVISLCFVFIPVCLLYRRL